MKDSLIIYASQIEALDDFTLEERGEVMTAIMAHIRGREVPTMSRAAAIAWAYIKKQADFDGEKYEEKVKARAEAGRKGAEKRWQSMAKMANANFANSKNGKRWQSMAKIADSDSDSDKDSDKDSEYVPHREGHGEGPGHTPTAAQVEEYARSIGYDIDAQGFVDKYSATGWILNGGPIRDWKALVRRWKTQDEKRAPEKNTKIHNFEERGDDLDDETARKWREKVAARRAERERTSVV